MFSRLRNWWQIRAGEDETLDGDVPAWGISVLFHLAVLVVVALLTIETPNNQINLTLTAPLADVDERLEPQEFEFAPIQLEEVGAESLSDTDVAFSQAPLLADVADVAPPQLPLLDQASIRFETTWQVAQGLTLQENLAVKGATGVGTTGAAGAVDRLTQEILLSLEERPTLVVWLFDQSASLTRQRQEIHDRFAQIYDELGAVGRTHRQGGQTESPLLSSIVAFGSDVNLLTEIPTADIGQLKRVSREIERDDSGIEHVFRAILMSAHRYRKLRTGSGGPARNVMLVAFTDEVGDDQQLLEDCVATCRQLAMPVYVVGVPAPFGRKQARVKWVDPDPNYDQTPQWGLVDQGPESLLPERIELPLPGSTAEAEPIIDSGFGPFALTRLCYETGGIYFSVHPNRQLGEDLRGWETEAFSAYLQRFFDPATMRRYRPLYVSRDKYLSELSRVKSRGALVQAATAGRMSNLRSPRTHFVGRDEADLARQWTEAQKAAAILEPLLDRLVLTLQDGEDDRRQEQVARWQAGYDLALGRALAAKVRTEAYNVMLAQAKQGMKFQDERDNTWTLQPADQLEVGSKIEKQADKAREYLQRVVREHPGTPWAYLAELELRHPVGWRWLESYTDLAPRRSREGDNRADRPPPADDQRQMLERPKPQRPLPKL